MRVTFLLLSYNQAAYAAEAVKGALGQVGEPISILISDDASSDDTFRAIQSVTETYSGPHRLTLNRNQKNLGLAAHLNACMEKIDTDYVIVAAADDFSLPERTIKTLAAFESSGAKLVHSRVREMGPDGQDQPGTFPERAALFFRTTSARQAAVRAGLYIGATGAWHRSLFDRYGGIGEGCYEDAVLGFRASLEQRIALVDEPLVRYRMDVGISAQNDAKPAQDADWMHFRVRALDRLEALYRQRLHDAQISSHPDRELIIKDLRGQLVSNELRKDSYVGSTGSYLTRNIGSLPEAARVLVSERLKRRRARD